MASRGKAGASRQAKSAGTKRAPAKKAAGKSDLDRRWSLLLFGLGLFFFIVSVVPGESGWAWMRQNILFGAFGISGWLIGPLMIYWGVLIGLEKAVVPAVIKGVLFMVALCGVSLVFSNIDLTGLSFGEVMAALHESGRTNPLGGGVLSAILGASLLALTGRIAARILLLVIFALAIMVAAGKTPGDVGHLFYRFGDFVASKFYGDEDEDGEELPPARGPAPAAPPKAQPAAELNGRPGAVPPTQKTNLKMPVVDVPIEPEAPSTVPPAPTAPRANNKMWQVDIQLDDPVQEKPVDMFAEGASVSSVQAPRFRDSRVDIDLGGTGPASTVTPGHGHPLDIGPGGTFGQVAINQANANKPWLKQEEPAPEAGQEEEFGLGDYEPLVPFGPGSPVDDTKVAPKDDILLFGEHDPYANLGGPKSKLPVNSLPEVEYIAPESTHQDPDFDLFGRSVAPHLPDMPPPVQPKAPESLAEGNQTAGSTFAQAQSHAQPQTQPQEEPAAPALPAPQNADPAPAQSPAQDPPPWQAAPPPAAEPMPMPVTPVAEDAFVEERQGNGQFEALNKPSLQPPAPPPGPATMAGEAPPLQDPQVDAMIEKAAAVKEDRAVADTRGAAFDSPAYEYPPLNLFEAPPAENADGAKEEMKNTADLLVNTLSSFGVETRILDVSRGPSVTRYEIQPQVGVKISRITNLSDDIALNLAAAGVRIEAPIPGKPAVGIEVPNKVKSAVPIRSILESTAFTEAKSPLSLALGKDIAGEPVVADLTRMPHLLIAGSTGSGKSVCINSIVTSILYKSSPEEVKLILIDPKVVELAEYNGIPHLLIPVVTEPKQAAKALGQAVGEMEKRYHLFAEHNVRDIGSFNKYAKRTGAVEPIPHIAIIIDELADLMMTAGKDVENFICRIAQKARAAGMHLIVATQRPSVDVITGLIKNNIPSRIAFAVSSQVDSRTILDGSGAEKLLGMGDMLFMPIGANKPLRVQGAFVKDKEISKMLDYIKEHHAAQYDESVLEEMEKVSLSGSAGASEREDDENGSDAISDPVFQSAVDIALDAGEISTSGLQRRLRLGYARAGRIVDQMEQLGIVSEPNGSKPRQVLITRQDWQELVMNAGG